MTQFNWHIGSYRRGRATSQSDYIWRRNQFATRDDLIATGCGNLPAWCQGDPRVFFSAADRHERENGSACRHLVITLPRELGLPEWVALVDKLVAQDLGRKPYQYGIHNPGDGAEQHPHAHIVYSDRVPDEVDRPPEVFFRRSNPKSPELGGCKKDSGGRSAKQLRLEVIGRKKLWADLQNDALREAGRPERVDHRSEPARIDPALANSEGSPD